jgi:hypothetical protein
MPHPHRISPPSPAPSTHACPREIRDIIYSYLLTGEKVDIIDTICRTTILRPECFPFPNERYSAPAPSPAFTNPDAAYKPFVHELLAMLYEFHTHLCVTSPSALKEFLDTGFFGSGWSPRRAKLGKLRIKLDLSEADARGFNGHLTLASDL